jgi:hypothetical protein
MLVPEIWCRMRVQERDPKFLIDNGLLERVQDFELDGRTILASRLGYRITALFVDRYLGRIFETPDAVFTEELLRPEKQSVELFASGVEAIVEAQRRVALNYFEDGSVESACPPLKALLHIMARGSYEGMDLNTPAFRALFEREALLASDWYRERLRVKQQRDIVLWNRHVSALETFRRAAAATNHGFSVEERLQSARAELARVNSPAYLEELRGTIGADPFHGQIPS